MAQIYPENEIEIDAGDWCFQTREFWRHLVLKCINFDEFGEAYFCSHQVIREQDDYGPEIIASDLRCYWHESRSSKIADQTTVDEQADWEETCDDGILDFSEVHSDDLLISCVTIKNLSEDLNYEIQARIVFDGIADLRKFTVTALSGVDEEAANAISGWFALDVIGS